MIFYCVLDTIRKSQQGLGVKVSTLWVTEDFVERVTGWFLLRPTIFKNYNFTLEETDTLEIDTIWVLRIEL